MTRTRSTRTHAHTQPAKAPPSGGLEAPRKTSQSAEETSVPDGARRAHMVAEAAYYRALNRGFDGSDPNEDWYAAEREIDQRYGVTH